MIYIHTDEKVILERLQHNSSKDPALMLKSKNYLESYMTQKTVFEIPSEDEADFFIQYDGINFDELYKRIKDITNHNLKTQN
jgi:hypothetical protein